MMTRVAEWRIHVGAHKTATTRLQETLSCLPDELRRQTLFFIETHRARPVLEELGPSRQVESALLAQGSGPVNIAASRAQELYVDQALSQAGGFDLARGSAGASKDADESPPLARYQPLGFADHLVRRQTSKREFTGPEPSAFRPGGATGAGGGVGRERPRPPRGRA